MTANRLNIAVPWKLMLDSNASGTVSRSVFHKENSQHSFGKWSIYLLPGECSGFWVNLTPNVIPLTYGGLTAKRQQQQ